MTQPQPHTMLSVRLTPRAPREEVGGWKDGALQVRVTAPPVEGRANAALVRLVAAALGIAPSAVAVVAGEKSRHKRLRIEGLDESEVRRRLG